ncbi:hypothetical protein GCM10022213_23270 [Parerythrobacter jejuensis]
MIGSMACMLVIGAMACMVSMPFAARSQDQASDPFAADTLSSEPPVRVEMRTTAPLRVRLSEDLEPDDAAAIRSVIDARPGWEIGARPHYEIVPNPEFFEHILLVPIKGMTDDTLSAFDPALQKLGPMSVEDIFEYYAEPSHEARAWASNVPQPIDLGFASHPDFLPALGQNLDRFYRRKALLALESSRGYGNGSAVCISVETPLDDTCPMPGPDGWNTVPVDRPAYFTVRSNSARLDSFITVVMITPNGEIVPVLAQPARAQRYGYFDPEEQSRYLFADNLDAPVSLGQPGRYDVLTIVSDEPIDPRIWRLRQGMGAHGEFCRNGLERNLCRAMIGSNLASEYSGSANIARQILWATAYRGGTGYVTNGTLAELGVSRWQAQLFTPRGRSPLGRSGRRGPGLVWLYNFEKSHKCGGSYLGDGFVLTAAHCVSKAGMKDLYVRLGTRNITTGGNSFAVQSIAVHNRSKWSSQRADVALIKLRPSRRLATLQQQGKLAAIPIAQGRMSALPRGSTVTVTGWGLTGAIAPGGDAMLDQEGNAQRNPRHLLKANLSVRPTSECTAFSSYRFFSAGEVVCAGSGTAGRDACFGDSGGPLTRSVRGRRVLVGIVSAGIGCGQDNTPGVYMRASRFTGWVNRAKSKLRRVQSGFHVVS